MCLNQTESVKVLAKFVTTSKALLVFVLISGCNTITYTASCNPGDSLCQRNQNAQTLAIIGQREAATQLMCSDDSVKSYLGKQCAGRE